MLPTLDDPKLWMVECKPGKEKESVFSLLKKFSCIKEGDNKFNIISASAIDRHKGSIFVEAWKKNDVIEAIAVI